jgi:hypothetical protein
MGPCTISKGRYGKEYMAEYRITVNLIGLEIRSIWTWEPNGISAL